MYKIEWVRSSAGWDEPKCDGEHITGSFGWVQFAERANELEADLAHYKAEADRLQSEVKWYSNMMNKGNQELEDMIRKEFVAREKVKSATALAEKYRGGLEQLKEFVECHNYFAPMRDNKEVYTLVVGQEELFDAITRIQKEADK